MLGYIDRASQLHVSDYERACTAREGLRAMHRALEDKVDGFITLAHIGPGQVGQPPTGTPWYNDASSAIGAPALNLPLLAVEGLPLGVQLVGFEHRDTETLALARWLLGL
jgi:Asp-tRNA(Asn)/Glu-tRNA(Gln) amidotransferase A subunit family amidase